jgi:tetratricopeptide (TPR) repeat protein
MLAHRYVLVAAALTLAAPVLAQDWKGMGRLEGRVLDPDGKPLPDVTVKLNLPSRGGGTTIKTDKKGHWAIGGIASGAWQIDLEAPGYAVKKITLNLPSESARLAPVDVKLEKAAPAGPAPEVREALEKGDAAFKEGRFAEARVEYQKLLALRPELADTLNRQIAFTYSREGNYAKEVEYLEKVLQANPTDLNLKLLTAQEALQGGMLDKGLELLKGIDDSTIKDPAVFYNVAVLLRNAQKPEEAIVYLTKAITVDPTYVDGYFQRGLAYLGLQKTPEAKADFQKVIELAPTGAQAETAKKALQQLK